MEVIPGEDVTEKSLHPYTQALLGAQFSIHMDQNKKIESIESEAPSLWMFLMLSIPESLRTLHGEMQDDPSCAHRSRVRT